MNEPRWTTREKVSALVGFSIIGIIFASLYPTIASEIEASDPAPVIGIYSLWPLLVIIALVLIPVTWAVYRHAPPDLTTEEQR